MKTIRALAALLLVQACTSHAHKVAGARRDTVVPILVYHSVAPHHPGQTIDQRILDVDPKVFERQLDRLVQDSITVISLGRFVDALDGRATLPPRAVVITFDDGWESQYRHAYPALKRRGLPATFFVITKDISHDSLSMTWPQLREMARAGMTIGSHTRTHPELGDLLHASRSEIRGSSDDIQRMLGARPVYFAYPFCEYNAREEGVVHASGFRAARTCERGVGVENRPSDMYALNSVFVTDDSTKFERLMDVATGKLAALPRKMASAPRRAPRKKPGLPNASRGRTAS